jgi:hypothetical protein
MTTELLERAFTQAAGLSQDQQNAIASLVLREMESEQQWDERFACSQDALAELADEAVMEFERGETKPLEELLGIEND